MMLFCLNNFNAKNKNNLESIFNVFLN